MKQLHSGKLFPPDCNGLPAAIIPLESTFEQLQSALTRMRRNRPSKPVTSASRFFVLAQKKILGKTVPTASSELFLQLLQKPAYFFSKLSDESLLVASQNWLNAMPPQALNAQTAE